MKMNVQIVLIFVAILFVNIIGNAQTTTESTTPRECGEHEEWNTCGPACPKVCGKFKPRPCVMMCVPSCQCTPGYFRNSIGKCVPRHKC
uniref:TIL domain-containing protein n=1 Tax=Panagrolaimus sp. ES5 TaxID=591445 RepID=A0AC34FPP1_9BILA